MHVETLYSTHKVEETDEKTGAVTITEVKEVIGYVERTKRTVRYFRDLDGKILHREDGPAYIDLETGTEIWYRNGEKHRDGDQPAFTSPTMYQWYVDGKRHRVGGPAVKHRDSDYCAYYINDRLHRVGGPAVVYDNGDVAYYYDGHFVVGITENGAADLGPCIDTLKEWGSYRDMIVSESIQNAEESEPISQP